MLPEDCTFTLPVTYAWELEGDDCTFTYTVVTRDSPTPMFGVTPDGGMGYLYNHKHEYKCPWYCIETDVDLNYCKNDDNAGSYTKHKHTKDCSKVLTVYTCGDKPLNDKYVAKHEHVEDCKHSTHCTHYGGPSDAADGTPSDNCHVIFHCLKPHYILESGQTITATWTNFQDILVWGEGDDYDIDPVSAYIAVVTDEHNSYDSETNAEVQLIDQDGNVTDHIVPGEKYKVRYIFTYEGASKGFKINKSSINKTLYSFPYTTRMTTNSSIKSLKDSYVAGVWSTPHGILELEETKVDMRGIYKMGQQFDGVDVENVYPDHNYTFNSDNDWDDTIYLDALNTDNGYDNYTKKSTTDIKNSSDHKNNVTVTRTANHKLKVVWTFDTDYEVFTSSYLNITGYISVGSNKNYSKDYFEATFNYGETENHNYVGGDGYFTRRRIVTKNSEYPTYAVKNKVYHSNMDLKVDDVVLNTGAGTTQPMYQKVGTSYHDINYNLYYTLKLTHTRAYTYERLVTKANNEDTVYHDPVETPIDTSDEKYEFDVNTKIDLAINSDKLGNQNLSFVSVDHIKSDDKIYIQKVIPVRLPVVANNKTTSLGYAEAKVTTNYDRMLYEDYYAKPAVTNNGTSSKLSVRTHSGFYLNNNSETAKDYIYTAMNPNNLRPTTIKNSKNVNKNNYSSSTPTTFNIKLANGVTTSVKDSNTTSYKQYEFSFNTGKVRTQVVFPSYRDSASMFKYSGTEYKYNGNTIKPASGSYTNSNQSQTERYYISEVLFKSNYTSKYNLGTNKDGWVDMVNNNANAIVVAGQGFELKVTVKYENTFLNNYFTRYIKDSGYTGDDGQSTTVGTSMRSSVNKPQYCNISALTVGNNDSNTKIGYISGFNTTDRLFAKMLNSVSYKVVTGSNVYSDLFVYMNDNKDTVYSYSGIYSTPVIFERNISYNADCSVVTITYTMKKSAENGVASSFQNMKFYTNSLASNSTTPGIIHNNTDVSKTKQHSITLWTPIITATDFNYPNDKGTRYIGDAIELGYTITTDLESIIHIVQ